MTLICEYTNALIYFFFPGQCTEFNLNIIDYKLGFLGESILILIPYFHMNYSRFYSKACYITILGFRKMFCKAILS